MAPTQKFEFYWETVQTQCFRPLLKPTNCAEQHKDNIWTCCSVDVEGGVKEEEEEEEEVILSDYS